MESALKRCVQSRACYHGALLGSSISRQVDLIQACEWRVWQGSGSSKNNFGSDSYDEVTSLNELEPFDKMFYKTAPSVFLTYERCQISIVPLLIIWLGYTHNSIFLTILYQLIKILITII
jgi:hypothetical protein